MNNWREYFYHQDLGAAKEELLRLPVGPLNEHFAQLLASGLANADVGECKSKWNFGRLAPTCGVDDGVVVYNGKNISSLPTKYKCSNVVILEYPESDVTLSGRIYLCFNAPEEVITPDETSN
jgi:hypothetical protein